jgi:hypothetical protein
LQRIRERLEANDAEDERAVTGDWEDDPAPYAGWA